MAFDNPDRREPLHAVHCRQKNSRSGLPQSSFSWERVQPTAEYPNRHRSNPWPRCARTAVLALAMNLERRSILPSAQWQDAWTANASFRSHGVTIRHLSHEALFRVKDQTSKVEHRIFLASVWFACLLPNYCRYSLVPCRVRTGALVTGGAEC
jgi:hypothetical protein